MRIAKPCESSNFRTHIAVPVLPGACLLECQRTLFVSFVRSMLIVTDRTNKRTNGCWWGRWSDSRPHWNCELAIALPKVELIPPLPCPHRHVTVECMVRGCGNYTLGYLSIYLSILDTD